MIIISDLSRVFIQLNIVKAGSFYTIKYFVKTGSFYTNLIIIIKYC